MRDVRHTRTDKQEGLAAERPHVEGVPDEEALEGADVEERLDQDPVAEPNRRDVPPTPENSIEARTEDD